MNALSYFVRMPFPEVALSRYALIYNQSLHQYISIHRILDIYVILASYLGFHNGAYCM